MQTRVVLSLLLSLCIAASASSGIIHRVSLGSAYDSMQQIDGELSQNQQLRNLTTRLVSVFSPETVYDSQIIADQQCACGSCDQGPTICENCGSKIPPCGKCDCTQDELADEDESEEADGVFLAGGGGGGGSAGGGSAGAGSAGAGSAGAGLAGAGLGGSGAGGSVAGGTGLAGSGLGGGGLGATGLGGAGLGPSGLGGVGSQGLAGTGLPGLGPGTFGSIPNSISGLGVSAPTTLPGPLTPTISPLSSQLPTSLNGEGIVTTPPGPLTPLALSPQLTPPGSTEPNTGFSTTQFPTNAQANSSVLPEPSSYLIFSVVILGMLGLGWRRDRRVPVTVPSA